MIKAIDFFCGAGGLTRGLRDAGIQVLAGVDNDDRLRQTYERNNNFSRFVHSDIDAIDISKLRSDLNIGANDLTLYAACTPCQPFSTLNTSKREDDRKALLLKFGNLISASPPDFIIVENVPGINGIAGKEIYDAFTELLHRQGYRPPTADKLDAKDYGVPQTRKRFIMMASLHGRPDLPTPVPHEERTVVADWISKYPAIADGESHPTFKNHAARKLPPHHKRIVAAVPKDGGSRKDIADRSILLKCHQRNPEVHKEVFGRMAWQRPAPTLTCRCTDVYCGRFIHPEQDRGISLREAAALQTFEDDYEFFGKSLQERARQIGNAVPVKFAQALGNAIKSFDG